MSTNTMYVDPRLETLIESIEIPPHYYELAKKRYESLADWLHREGSPVTRYDPVVYPQGSFRYGTVIRPLLESEEYDLDLVSELQRLTKSDVSQHDLKHLVGNEVKAYAQAYNLKHPVEEKKRCWCLDYADKVKFHMDILPAIPDDDAIKQTLIRAGVPEAQARHAIAITDKRHPRYNEIQCDWPRSNSKGYPKWFQERMRSAAEPRLVALVEKRVYASVDKVPAYQWKTPLQRAIQFLKRHRDVMFKDSHETEPISMIITTLAARGYEGETRLYDALVNIVRKMPQFVRAAEPRVPNPVNPDEDFADKWKSDARLERGFRLWHQQVKADIDGLAGRFTADEFRDFARRKLAVNIGQDRARDLANGGSHGAGAAVVAPTVTIKNPPRPWAADG